MLCIAGSTPSDPIFFAFFFDIIISLTHRPHLHVKTCVLLPRWWLYENLLIVLYLWRVMRKKVNFWGKFVWQVPEVIDVRTPKPFQFLVELINEHWRKNFGNRRERTRVIVETTNQPNNHPTTQTDLFFRWNFIGFLEEWEYSKPIGVIKNFENGFMVWILCVAPSGGTEVKQFP